MVSFVFGVGVEFVAGDLISVTLLAFWYARRRRWRVRKDKGLGTVLCPQTSEIKALSYMGGRGYNIRS